MSQTECVAPCQITWNIYQRQENVGNALSQWRPYRDNQNFEHNHLYGRENDIGIKSKYSINVNDLFFSGANTANFTATTDLFRNNPQVKYWRFEVIYQFPSQIGASTLDFQINEPPENGSCSIEPQSGTTSTRFKIICPDWVDQHGIHDYSVYGKRSAR